jgi:hypothetical protein
MVEDDGDDGGEAFGVRGVGEEPVPEANDVAEHAEGHEEVFRALVLQEDEEEGVAAIARYGEDDVGVELGEVFVDDADGLAAERSPVEAGG